MGHEMGALVKPKAEVRFVLAFPDVYEVGMSHLGLKILYTILNDLPWLSAERVFAPWPDMEEVLRREGIPLATLETGISLAEAHIVGFTLQYELSYTNVLNMLELGGVPVMASERGDADPLIIGGGPCTANPEPLADFFDAFVLGDGEEVALELASAVRAARSAALSRAELLERLAEIPGVYIPSFFEVEYAGDGKISRTIPRKGGNDRIRRRFLADLETARYPDAPVIPFMKTVHDRVSIEIARGCTRGCRFCQAGYIYRPVRERSPEKVLDCVAHSLRATGFDEISLLSLSTGDYSCVEPLIKSLMARYADERIAVSLPSLRVGTLTAELVEEIKKVRKTGFTLAPEAGSDRLRQAINKGITEQDLLDNAYAAYAAGWRLIKLYFMIGLPGETEDDLLAIVDLARKVKAQAKRVGRGGEVNVSVSTFVPKAHTPFQWEPQIDEDVTRARHQLLRQELRRGKLNFKWHDPHLSSLEGVFARGDRRLGALLRRARTLGCRFDGWSDQFDNALWHQALNDCGIDPSWYLRNREPDEVLPWDHLDFGVNREFLRAERERAGWGVYTEDCRNGKCSGCGVCDFEKIKMRLVKSSSGEALPAAPNPIASKPDNSGAAARIRLCFEKKGAMRLLSHLEMLNLFTRAVGRAGIPIRFSQGFHPHPRFSFATALSVGVESLCEYMDMEVTAGYAAQQVVEGLNGVLPEGIYVRSAEEIPLNTPALSVIIREVRYRVTAPQLCDLDLKGNVAAFLALDSYPWRREKRGKVTELDLRRETLEIKPIDCGLELVVSRGKPVEFVAAVTGLLPEQLAESRIEKLEVIFSDSHGLR